MERQDNITSGIRLRRLNRIMIAITVALAVALLLVCFSTIRSFRNLEQTTDRYIRARQDAADMQAGSDYLTDRVRTFIVTGNRSCAEDFFYEIETTRRRDIAIESMDASLSGSDTARYLSEALRASNELAAIEIYAMRLAVEGNGFSLAEFPAALRDVALSAEDLALSPEQQLSRAQEMVFDETYQAYKQSIRDNIALCEQALIGETEGSQQESSRHMEAALTAQALLIAVVVLVVATMVVYIARLVIRPAAALVDAISQERPAEELGAFEMRFLSRTFNTALRESRQHQEDLSYKASHDSLTGLLNRGAFEKARTVTRGRAQAMFIFDIDRFKAFNDEFGHDMGDRVLQKVARVLRSNFREEDYVCRFGGDEFTVLMVHVTGAMRPLVERKLAAIRAALRDTADGLPVITLSIGVAFSDRPAPTDDILKDADTALYQTKDRGKDGFTFYGDGSEPQPKQA